jgi:hypothetical protein
MDWQDLATFEYTTNSGLIPADPIRWPVDAQPEQMFALTGWRFGGALGDREPPGDPVTAHVFAQEETGEVLVELLALGVPAWILCRSRIAYLMFVLVGLRPLVELNRPDAARELLDHAVCRLGDTLADRLENMCEPSVPSGPGQHIQKPPAPARAAAREET